MKCLLPFLLLLAIPNAWGQTERLYYPRQREDYIFLQGLRQRHLYHLAECYCKDKLLRGDLSLPERAILTSELIVTLNEWGMETEDSNERQSRWQEAISVAEAFYRRFPTSDWRFIVALMDLKYRITVASAIREEMQLGTAYTEAISDASFLDEIRSILRKTINALKDREAELQEVFRRPKSWSGNDDGSVFQEQQWLSLEKHLQFELARGFAELARTYPAKSEDHTAGMVEAARRLEVLSQLPLDHPLGVPSRLALARILRELGDGARAIDILKGLAEEKLSLDERFALRAELIRLALATQQKEELDKLLAMGRLIEGKTAAQLDNAFLEAFLEKWKDARANNSDEARAWEAKIREILNGLRQNGPAFWARRAELLVTRQIAGNQVHQDIDMNVYLAENAYRAKRWEEALAAFDRARKAAEQQGNPVRALQLGLAAAAIEHERERHQEAWRRYQDLYRSFSDQEGAKDAAELAIFHVGQLAKENPTEFLPLYQQELENYLRMWPQSEFACQAALYLGKIHNHFGHRIDAANYLLLSLESWLQHVASLEPQKRESAPIAPDTPSQSQTSQYSVIQTVSELETVTARILQDESQRPDTRQRLRELAQHLATWAKQARAHAPEQDWSLRVASIAAQLLLKGENDPHSADAVLKQFLPEPLDTIDHLDVTVKARSITLKLECDAWLNQSNDNAQTVRFMREMPIEARLTVLEDFGTRLSELPPQVRKRLALSLAHICEDLPKEWSSVPAPRRPQLGLAYSYVLMASDNESAALSWLRQLAAEFPDAADIQEEYALLLARQDRMDLRQEALERFRAIAQGTPEGSPRWFRAKYMTAWLLIQLGQPERALEMIRVLEAIHPELGGDALRDRFRRLRALCENQITNSRPTSAGTAR